MNRRSNTTILAILILAVCSAWAAPAQAEPLFEADSYPATLDGTAEGSTTVFTFGESIKWECKKHPFSGSVAAKSNSLTLTPSYSECRWRWPVMATEYSLVQVFMNGCDYRMHSLSRLKADEYKSLLSLECPVGQQVVIELNEGPETICRLTVPAQTNKSEVRWIDKTGKEGALDDVEALVNVKALKYTQDLSKLFFPCPVKAGTYEDLRNEGGDTITGTSEAGKQIGFRLAGE